MDSDVRPGSAAVLCEDRRSGTAAPLDDLVPLIYYELREIAHRQLVGDPRHTEFKDRACPPRAISSSSRPLGVPNRSSLLLRRGGEEQWAGLVDRGPNRHAVTRGRPSRW